MGEGNPWIDCSVANLILIMNNTLTSRASQNKRIMTMAVMWFS